MNLDQLSDEAQAEVLEQILPGFEHDQILDAELRADKLQRM